MDISPISLGASGYSDWIAKNNKIAKDLTDALLLTNPTAPEPGNGLLGVDTGIFGVINAPKYQIEFETREPAGFLQMMYLQYPNKRIKALAESIVNPNDTDDVKAWKLQWYVTNYIQYKTDKEVYGKDEVWQPPVVTDIMGTGDCEDQAFLLHSLMLNAGIPADRIRTYGGWVDDGEGTYGGHAWTAYRRESDNEWIVLDTTYYPDLSNIWTRPLMKDSEFYVKGYFYITLTETVTTLMTDRIHNPDMAPIYTSSGKTSTKPVQSGLWINEYA